MEQLFTPELTIYAEREDINKKQALLQISKLASQADSEVKFQNILDQLLQRERLGDTSIGNGIAIPHAKIPLLKHPLCIAFHLIKPINFSQKEVKMVDLIFCLLVPEEDHQKHLDLLAQLASCLKKTDFIKNLRATKNKNDFFQILEDI